MADDTQSRALVGEISHWTHKAVEEAKRANAAEAALRASEEREKVLRERVRVLIKFVRHEKGCVKYKPYADGTKENCTCGLDAAFSQEPAPKEQP